MIPANTYQGVFRNRLERVIRKGALNVTSIVAKPQPRTRFRIGIRGMLALILMFALLFGWFHRSSRIVSERDALVSALQSERVIVNHNEPSYLNLFLMKIQGTDSRSIERRYKNWISPGWFSKPVGFNAGRLPDDKVKPLVERLQSLGPVNEVLFRGGTLDGLRLFYIGEVPYQNLGPERGGCLITEHRAKGSASL